MGSEVRLAIRRLAKEPALALAAVLTLALGIGACTAMFSIVEAVLLKSMDVAQPQRLVVMWPQLADAPGEFSYNAYLELGRQSAIFERVALSGSANWPVPVDILLPDGRRTRATQCAVSDTFFDVLGARPLLGRRIVREHPWRSSSAPHSGRQSWVAIRQSSAARCRSAAMPGESSASCRRNSFIPPALTSGRPPRRSWP
jgi:hypothetical protein